MEPESVLSVAWSDHSESDQQFMAGVLTQAHNVPGVIFRVAELLNHMNVNIEDVTTHGDNKIKETRWIIHVRDLEHLKEVIRLVEHVPSVIRVKRLKSGTVEKDEANYFRD